MIQEQKDGTGLFFQNETHGKEIIAEIEALLRAYLEADLGDEAMPESFGLASQTAGVAIENTSPFINSIIARA